MLLSCSLPLPRHYFADYYADAAAAMLRCRDPAWMGRIAAPYFSDADDTPLITLSLMLPASFATPPFAAFAFAPCRCCFFFFHLHYAAFFFAAISMFRHDADFR